MPLGGERLHHAQFVNHFSEVFRGELTAPIRVEQDALGYASGPDGVMVGKRSILGETWQAMTFSNSALRRLDLLGG